MADAGVRATGATAPAGTGQRLETHARKQQAVALLGLRALAGSDLQALMGAAAEAVGDMLDAEFCEVLELRPDGRSLLLRAGVGWRDGLVGRATVGSGIESQAGYTLLSTEPVIVDNLRAERRFSGSRLLNDHSVISGLSVVIHGSNRAWGVLGAHSAARRSFTDADVNAIQSVANVLAAAIERALAEDALSESEERFRTLVEMAPDAIFSISIADGAFTALSPAFERLTGWPRAGWLGRPFRRLIVSDDLPAAMEQFALVLEGQSPPPFELRVRGRDNAEIVGEFRIAPKIENGQVVELFGIARDVSERRRTEEELRRSRDELEIILRGVAEGITVQDASGKLVYANDAAARLTGCATVDELLTTPIPELLSRYEMFDDDGNPFPLERLPGRAAIQGRQLPPTMICFRVVESGEERWSLVSATPVLDQQGLPRYAINIFHDVTERKRTERLQNFLVEATELLATDLDYEETLYRVARIATPFLADVCVFDILQPDGVIRRIAAHPDSETERHIHELVKRHPIEPQHPAMRAIVSGETSVFETISPTVFESIGMEAERASMIAELGFRSVVVVPLVARGRRIGALSLIYAESGRRYSAADLPVVHELARRSATAIDNALLYHESQQAAARLRALAEASHAFAEASLDLPAVLDSVARSAGKLIGDQCILRLLSDDGTLLPAVALYHPDPTRLSQLTELMANEVQRADEGLVGSVMMSGEPILIPAVSPDKLRQTITAGHRDDIDRTPLHSVVIVQVRVRERVIGTLGLGRERTGDPYTEEDLLLLQELADRAGLAIENARLYREARDAVRSREQFLSIASHELKTPLTSVKASAQLLDRRLRQDPIDRARVGTLVGQLQSEISRLESLVLDLLDATRIQQGHLALRREQVDLVDLARQAIERFESSPQRLPGHELILGAIGPVQATIDPGRIDQVITNLVSNALKYSPEGGEVRVAVSALDDCVEIAISDTGIGISAEEQAELFQPFARGDVARQSIGGTGLGLFISAEIVERHGGTIEVESVPGLGSTFTVRLPLDPPPAP